MWMILRLVALSVLVVVGALVAGQGDTLLERSARVLAAIGIGSEVPRATGPLPPPTVYGGIALGWVVAVLPPLDRAVRQLVTLLHELGHTVVAAASGARPAGIVLRHDASGHATARWIGRPTPLRRLALAAVAFAGLPAAATASAAGAQLLTTSGPEAVLWGLALAGVVVAMLARSPWSLSIAVGLAGLAVAALRDVAAPWAAAVVVAVLTAVVVRTTVDNGRASRARLHPGDDARVVGGHLRLPARLVQVAQVVVATAAGAWTVWALLQELPTIG